MRKTWVYIDGVAYEKGTEPKRSISSGPTVMGDLPDVVSPIDGTIIRGRAGLREHCLRHNVVPTADLKGLPTKRPEVRPDSREIKKVLGEIMNAKNFQRGY